MKTQDRHDRLQPTRGFPSILPRLLHNVSGAGEAGHGELAGGFHVGLGGGGRQSKEGGDKDFLRLRLEQDLSFFSASRLSLETENFGEYLQVGTNHLFPLFFF